MPKPLVSIIIPCYNNGQYLQECLDSVYRQSYSNYEVVVINDGSSDELTNSIVRGLAHPKLKVLESKNQGVSIARNTAIAASSGSYILPLDADDKIGPDFIRKAVDILEEQPEVKVVNCNTQLFGHTNAVVYYEAYSLEKLLGKNLMTVSSLFRKKDFEQTAGFNANMKEGFEDWDFWISLLKTGGDVVNTQEVEFFYRIKRQSRNADLQQEHHAKLRRQIYENHRELYARYLLDPMSSFEYELILQSKEYRLGKWLLSPIRKLLKWLS